MNKLFPLVCSIFVLYSATTIRASDLECNLTSSNASMVIATMEDRSLLDISERPFRIALRGKKFDGLEYGVESCFLHTNAGGGSEEENIYELPMSPENPGGIYSDYYGSSTFRANTALGKFKVYCTLVAPNVEIEKFFMTMSLLLEDRALIQNSENCKISPNKAIAKRVEVKSSLSGENDFVIKITHLQRILINSHLYVGFTTHAGSLPDVTLGTTNDYHFLTPSGEVECTINGKAGIVKARAYHDFVDVFIHTLLGSGENYVISCPDMLASIKTGSKYLPSIISVVDEKTHNYSMALNTYH